MFPLPTFLILGVQKGGTSALFNCLDSHPDICMAHPKEPVHFESRYHLGLRNYSETYFAHYTGEPVVGEARHRNLYLPYVPGRVQESLPQARFIVLLRHPSERAYSAWLNRVSQGYENLGFEEAILADMKRIEAGPRFETEAEAGLWCHGQVPVPDTGNLSTISKDYSTYVDTGYYAQQLKRYFGFFPRERFLILFSEEMMKRPEEARDQILRFIGADPGKPCLPLVPANVSSKKRKVREAVRRLQKGRTFWSRFMSTDRAFFDYSKAVPSGFRAFLNGHYLPHNRELETLLDVRLEHWEK